MVDGFFTSAGNHRGVRLTLLLLAVVVLMIPSDPGTAGNCTAPIGRNAAAFSPDGSTLAVVLDEGACPRWSVAISDRGGTVNWLGQRSADESAASISWAPDSQRFVVGFLATTPSIAVYDLRFTSPRRTIAQGTDPTWSPDGRWIAYERQGALRVVAPDGAGDRSVAVGDRPAWAPDSSRLAVRRGDSVFVVGLNGSSDRRVAAGERALWSPDGTRLAVLREGVSYLVTVDGSSERPIGPGQPIQWSSSGADVALLDSLGVLRLVNLSTGVSRRLAEDVSAVAVASEWDRIASVIRVGRRSEVYLTETWGGPPHQITGTQCGLYTARCLDGTDRADRIVGTPRRDAVFPGAGDDRVRSGGGDDRIDTSYGRDAVYAGSGNDIVHTHGNDDVLVGGSGVDFLYPGNGEDRVAGGPGRDWVVTRPDRRIDVIRCGAGRDAVYAESIDRVARDCETVRPPVS
jgi:RTX calcium-binding nonapeptide repeat (4 copies)/WD40-like Beta Propeller Repeat